VEVMPGVEVPLSSGMTIVPLAGKIMVTRGSRAGRSYGENWELVVISREQIATVITGGVDPRISDMHALVYLKGEEWWIKDLNSSNGTRVNGTKIDPEAMIKPGDKITLGQTEFILRSAVKVVRRKRMKKKLVRTNFDQFHDGFAGSFQYGDDRQKPDGSLQ